MDGMNVNTLSKEQVAQNELQMLDLHAQEEERRKATPPVIGREQITKATEILNKYKEGKANLEDKIVKDEQYWKLRQWNRLTKAGEDYKPVTAWLWSCIQARHSDAMDSYPTCNFLARQMDDKEEAKRLSAIVPIIMEQNHYEEVYSDVARYTLMHGGGVQGVFWDKSKHNGLGDIEIKKIDFLNIFWEAGITDIQKTPNLFCVELVSKKSLEERYPETVGHLETSVLNLKEYVYDDHVDTSDKAIVIDWYYKKWVNGKQTVQYVKYVNDVVLYATENDTKTPTITRVDPKTKLPVIVPTGRKSMAETGLYDHGKYPFVCQALYPVEGSLCGYGLVDIGKDAQKQIDVINKALTENTVVNSTPRYFAKENSGVNEGEFLDVNKPIVHVAGNLEDNLEPIQSQQLGGVYYNVYQGKIDELKYVTANQDVGNGVAPSGVTAASAIAALQETQGKNARETNRALYRGYREVVYLVVENIRQFYDSPRVFRIAPDTMDNNEEQFITYTNEALVSQPQIVGGSDLGLRTPEFDIEVTAEKQSPYKKMEQNELALNFYAQGFFNPQNADPALACLQMMDFSHKEEIMQTVRRNGTLSDTVVQLEQMLLQLAMRIGDPALINQIGLMIESTNQTIMPQTLQEPIKLDKTAEEGTHMTKARNQARESTVAE